MSERKTDDEDSSSADVMSEFFIPNDEIAANEDVETPRQPDYTPCPECTPAKRDCKCTASTPPSSPPLTPNCHCPRDELDIVIHEETCLMYKNEKIIHPHTPEECECKEVKTRICECCRCLEDHCRCKKAGREVFDHWRANRDVGGYPTVLEPTHPLMQKFQASLSKFLEKENEVAEKEITELRDELKTSRLDYDNELEGIYRSDHDTNGQRMLIEEYEAALVMEKKKREEAEKRARELSEKYKQTKEKLDTDLVCERDSQIELEGLVSLVRQLEIWREETESDLTVSQKMTNKMKQEKRAKAEDKRQLDMYLYALNNEVWKLQAKLELFKKQMDVKNQEMDKVIDKVTAYSVELEDLELDKKRLISLWNSVLVNIKQRDKVFDSVREDYSAMQENYHTLMCNLDITKRMTESEMQRSKLLAMERDKVEYDIAGVNKIYEVERQKRENMEMHIDQINQAIEMTARDQEMVKMENNAMRNILSSTDKALNQRLLVKLNIENDILENLKNCLLNDKGVQAMAKGIQNMRDLARKLEISLTKTENQHAKMMLEIEIYKNQQENKALKLKKCQDEVREREKELELLQEKFDRKTRSIMQKQRDLDLVLKKYNTLKEIFDTKSPQERRIDELEMHIKELRERTEEMQLEWLRLQSHVVQMATHHHKLDEDIALINKQIQICEQRSMFTLANIEKVRRERVKLEQAMRDLGGRMEVLERTRNTSKQQSGAVQRANQAVAHEYAANLKGAETGLIDLEESIEVLDKEKVNLTQTLDHVTREALIWQRKGALAVELKRNMKTAQSAVGEVGQMKNEIHRMEVRREQLRRTSEKLSEDLALYVMRRETATDKTRASAAVEKARGTVGQTSQTNYKHKLRLVKSDVNRVTKELSEAKTLMEHLQEDQARLEKEIAEISAENAQLEENVATVLRQCREVDRNKQWMLERVVRSQRVGSELQRAVKRRALRIKKPKSTVLAEYNQARALNDRIRYITEHLSRDYPYLEEKFETVSNTLNIYTPSTSPRLTEDATCDLRTEDDEPGCVIIEEEIPPEPEKPYCRQEKDTCVDCKCTETD